MEEEWKYTAVKIPERKVRRRTRVERVQRMERMEREEESEPIVGDERKLVRY